MPAPAGSRVGGRRDRTQPGTASRQATRSYGCQSTISSSVASRPVTHWAVVPTPRRPPGERLLDRDRTLPSGPQRGRRQVRPDDGRVGRDGRVDVEGEIAVGDLEPALRALGLPARLQVQRERVDAAEVLDLLRARPERRASASRPSASTAAAGEQREPVGARLGGARALQQAVDDDDVGARELVPPGDPTPHERAVVDEQLEVQPRRQPARVAVAARRLVDAPQPTPEREVGGFDRVEQQRPVGAPVLDEQERRVTLELGQAERRLEPADDRLEEVTGDRRRVLDLAPREVRGVAGQVGEDQEAGLGCRCHDADRRPWSRSNVKTLAAAARPSRDPAARAAARPPERGIAARHRRVSRSVRDCPEPGNGSPPPRPARA